MASNTLAEIIEFVRDTIREPVEGFFTNDELTRRINLVTLRMVRKARLISNEATLLVLDAGFESAPLPADFMAVKKVYTLDSNGKTIALEKRGVLGRSAASLLNPGYYITGTQINFNSTYDSTSTIYIDYVYLPLEFVDYVTDSATDSSLPVEYTEVLEAGVSAWALGKKKDHAEGDRQANLYNAGLDELRKYVNERDGKQILNLQR